jgi:hypothetical protein
MSLMLNFCLAAVTTAATGLQPWYASRSTCRYQSISYHMSRHVVLKCTRVSGDVVHPSVPSFSTRNISCLHIETTWGGSNVSDTAAPCSSTTTSRLITLPPKPQARLSQRLPAVSPYAPAAS